ncbi:hypothetical protein [Anaerobacillus arseniciselenatis]|nr:hypothetical protein [Anaerobacillus arseniciselenatis]
MNKRLFFLFSLILISSLFTASSTFASEEFEPKSDDGLPVVDYFEQN